MVSHFVIKKILHLYVSYFHCIIKYKFFVGERANFTGCYNK
jgi:hypothetical protein